MAATQTPRFPRSYPRVIKSNRCRCKRCGDVIESKHQHDFVQCSCGAIFTDGGTDYLRRGGREAHLLEDLSETMTVEDAVNYIKEELAEHFKGFIGMKATPESRERLRQEAYACLKRLEEIFDSESPGLLEGIRLDLAAGSELDSLADHFFSRKVGETDAEFRERIRGDMAKQWERWLRKDAPWNF